MAIPFTVAPISPSTRRGLRSLLPGRRGSNRDGFALIAVIWSLGLITLLATAVIVGARYRTRIVSNHTSAAAAQAAAESAVNLGIAAALAGTAEANLKSPLQCRMPGGERVHVTIEQETGKIDLNTASLAALTRFFSALTRDQSQGMRIAARLAALRQDKPRDGAGAQAAAPAPRFATILQLDQVDGISPTLFRAALRFVTVRSGRTEPDLDAAPPALRRLLGIDQNAPAPARALPATGNITVRADVRSADGARYIQEALISLAEAGKPFVIREWRRGDLDPVSPASTASAGNAPTSNRDCFRPVEVLVSRSG